MMNALLLWAALMTASSVVGWYKFFALRRRFRKFCDEMRAFNTVSIPPGVLLAVVIAAGLAVWKRDEIKKFLADKFTEER